MQTYNNLYENNKLQTHARAEGIHFTKSMPYEILEFKTKKGEQGSVKDMEKGIFYCSEDGDVMFRTGKNNERKIWAKALFTGRAPETICTSAGKNVMKEYWEKEYFLKNKTLRDRYKRGYSKNDFSISDYKLKELNHNKQLSKMNGIFKDVSIVYPLFLVKAFNEMIDSRKMKEHLMFDSHIDKLDSYQTLEGYVCQALQDMNKFIEKADSARDKIMEQRLIELKRDYVKKMGIQGNLFDFNEDPRPQKENIPKEELAKFGEIVGLEGMKERSYKLGIFDFILKKEFGQGIFSANSKLYNALNKTHEILGRTKQINYSKKFLYLMNPEELLKEEGLAFEFGKGSCLSCDNNIISLVNGQLIYQGFGLSKGQKCDFDVGLMREILMKKLRFEKNEEIMKHIDEVSKKTLLSKQEAVSLFLRTPDAQAVCLH